MTTITIEAGSRAQEDLAIAEKKRLALTYLNEAWEGAMADGVDPEIVAHAALFTSLSDLVTTYGEEAVAELARSLAPRILAFEFSLERPVQ